MHFDTLIAGFPYEHINFSSDAICGTVKAYSKWSYATLSTSVAGLLNEQRPSNFEGVQTTLGLSARARSRFYSRPVLSCR
jgi:hypothetical protein